jgi:hypothetical protein
MRVATALGVSLRSWIVHVAAIFQPWFAWPQPMRDLQTPGVGEAMLSWLRRAGAGRVLNALSPVEHQIPPGP